MGEKNELRVLLALNCAASLGSIAEGVLAFTNGYIIIGIVAFCWHWFFQYRLLNGTWMSEYWKEEI